MRLLLFNLATDRDDPVLGFAAGWIDSFAERFEAVSVISMRVGRADFAPNVTVRSLGKELGYGEPRRLVRFYRQLRRALAEDRPDVCFSHMNPLFTVLGAPLLKTAGMPIVTWFTHPRLTWLLRVAHRVSDGMVSALPASYPYRSDKLTVTGHGIDTRLFAPDGDECEQPALISCVGRLAPAKDQLTLIRAAAALRERGRLPFRVRIIGSPAVVADRAYAAELSAEAARLGVAEWVDFQPGLPREELAAHYRRSTLHVNLTPQGFFDKVVLEAMSAGKPSLAANPSFSSTFGSFANRLLFRHRDPDDLAQKLEALLALAPAERTEIGRALRSRVLELHSLDGLTARIHDLLLAKMADSRPGERPAAVGACDT